MMEERAGLTQLAKIHTLLHRDVDGIKVDGTVAQAGTNAAGAGNPNQLSSHGSYANSTGTMVVSPNPIHPSNSLGARRGGIPISTSSSGPGSASHHQQQQQRRVSVASSTLAAALRRQQQQQQIIMQQQQANTNANNASMLQQYASTASSNSSNSSNSTLAVAADSNNTNGVEPEDSRTPSHSSLAALNPSPASDDFPANDATSSSAGNGVNGSAADAGNGNGNGNGGGRLRRPQIRSWKKTKETRQDALKNLDILANRYSAGASGLAAELNLGRRRVSSGSSSATPSNDVSDREEGSNQMTIETSQNSVKSPPPSASNATAPAKEKRSAFDSLEASIRKKGKEFSQLSHKFRDLVNDTLHIRSKKDKDKILKSANEDTPGKQTNGVAGYSNLLSVHSRDGSKTGSRNNSGNNSLSREQSLAVDAAIQSNNANHLSLNPALSSDSVDSSVTPMANLREREKQLSSQSERDREREGGGKDATPWKPRNSLLLASNLNGDASILDYSHPDPLPSPSSAHSIKSTSDLPSSSSVDKDSSGYAPSLLRTFTSPTSIRPTAASATNAHANNIPSTGSSGFLLPSASSVRDRDRDRATTIDSSDRERLPLFLRKPSDRRIDTSDSTVGAGPPKLDRDRSLSNAVLPTSSGLLLSPESSKLAGGDGSWRGVNQHAVEMELQLSDLESAFTQADIGGLRSRVELLEEMNRLKKSDVEVRLQRLENELANMKQVQRSNLKTIYDALNAANLSAGSGGGGGQRKEYQGVRHTLMNWIFILLTWFGLGIATLSQPLGAMYPYLTQLACCKRIFRKAGEVASMHANGGGSADYQSTSTRSASNSLTIDGDANQPSHQSISMNNGNGTTTSASSQSSFLSSGVMHHHTNDRDRESLKRTLKSTASSHTNSNSLRLPLNAILSHRDDGSNSAASSSRGQKRHANRDTHVQNGIPRQTTSAAAAAATAAADSFFYMDPDRDREHRSMQRHDDEDDDDDDEDADDMAVYGSAAVAAGMNSASSSYDNNRSNATGDDFAADAMESELHNLSDTDTDDSDSYPIDSHSNVQQYPHSIDASEMNNHDVAHQFESHNSRSSNNPHYSTAAMLVQPLHGTPPPFPVSSSASSSSSRRAASGRDRSSHNKSHKSQQPVSMMAQLRNASNKLKASRK